MTEAGAPRRQLRVLLLSPIGGRDPHLGDVSYTETLLADPPPGVTYVPYDRALADGTMRLRGRKPDARAVADWPILLVRIIELSLRRLGALFREPIWFATIDPAAFDLVHVHVFSLRQVGSEVPVVSTAGYPASELYRVRDGWSTRRARATTGLEARLASAANVHHSWLRPVAAGLMAVYTERFRRWLVDRGVPPSQVRVIGTATADLEVEHRPLSRKIVAFVGGDYLRKGGDVAVESVRKLRDAGLAVELIVVTRDASEVPHHPWICVISDAGRDEVVEVLAGVHALVLPTRSDCGAPFTVLESLNVGTPVVLSTDEWLDERLIAPGAVRVPVEASAVADAIRAAVDPATWAIASASARSLWERYYDIEAVGEELRRCYDDAIVIGEES